MRQNHILTYSYLSSLFIYNALRGLAETSLQEKLGEIKQQLNQQGLHIAINMKHDMPNEWHLFKKNGTVDLHIDKSKLPYFVQSLDVEIENVMFIARVKNNPTTFSVNVNGIPTPLSWIDEWKIWQGINTVIKLDTSFALTVTPPQLNNLEELMLVVKYTF